MIQLELNEQTNIPLTHAPINLKLCNMLNNDEPKLPEGFLVGAIEIQY